MKNGIVWQWARRGTNPRQPADQRCENAYLSGTRRRAALALPFIGTDAMQMHLDEISLAVARGSHAVLLLGRAGWHVTGYLKVPKNISLIFLPSRSPGLNPIEQIWQYLRSDWLSNRVFDTFANIIEAASDAWRRLTARPDVITSIGHARLDRYRSEIRAAGKTEAFLSHSIASNPAIVRHAVLKDWKPLIFGMFFFTRKWSLSMPCCGTVTLTARRRCAL